MDETTKVLVGVGVGAGVTLVVQFLGILKDSLQHRRSEKLDKNRWLRDKLHEIYGNSIASLASKSGPFVAKPIDTDAHGEYFKVHAEHIKTNWLRNIERAKWLNLLIIHFPFPNSKEYDNFVAIARNDRLTVEQIVDLASRDPRIKANA